MRIKLFLSGLAGLSLAWLFSSGGPGSGVEGCGVLLLLLSTWCHRWWVVFKLGRGWGCIRIGRIALLTGRLDEVGSWFVSAQ